METFGNNSDQSDGDIENGGISEMDCESYGPNEKDGLLSYGEPDAAHLSRKCEKISSKISTMYQSLQGIGTRMQNPLKGTFDVLSLENREMSQIIKQFKIFRNLVSKLKSAADQSGTAEDLALYKEADEKLITLRSQLADIDEGSMPTESRKNNGGSYNFEIKSERSSTNSRVGGKDLNFYNDEDEAQELILEEDRLTSRKGFYKDKDFNESYGTLSSLGKGKLRRSNGKDKFLNITFSSYSVCLRYIFMITVALISVLFFYILWMIRFFEHKSHPK